MNIDLEGIITRLKNGEVDALEILYNDMYVTLYAYAYSLLKNQDTASSMVQDVFIQIYEKATLYKEHTNPKAWIYTIMRNLILDHLRKNKKLIHYYDFNTIPSPFNETDKIAVHALIHELDEVSRQIVLLYLFEGFKHKEIAQLLDINESTVRWKYREALKTLEKKLRGDINEFSL